MSAYNDLIHVFQYNETKAEPSIDKVNREANALGNALFTDFMQATHS